MRSKLVLSACLFLFTIVACNTSVSDYQSEVNRLADLECRAIALRKQRFELANQMRFAQDTLLKPSLSANDSIRLSRELAAFNIQKEALLHKSLTLADTIQHQLDSLRLHQFKDVQEKRNFDEKLTEEIKKRGCDTDS